MMRMRIKPIPVGPTPGMSLLQKLINNILPVLDKESETREKMEEMMDK
jgi:hypothetical protein